MKPIFFECKVKYLKVMENGLQKPVTEAYLVDALSYTEAESRFLEKIRPFMHDTFEVDSITRVRISDIFFNDKVSADGNRRLLQTDTDTLSAAPSTTSAERSTTI